LGAARGGGCGGCAAYHIGWGKAFGLVGGGNGEIPAFLQKYAGGELGVSVQILIKSEEKAEIQFWKIAVNLVFC